MAAEPNAPAEAAIAAHRFGLGEASLDAAARDPRGWLLAQIGPADPQRAEVPLADSLSALRAHAEFVRARREARAGSAAMADTRPGDQQFAEHFRALVWADLRARLGTAATTERPFAERLALFWSNHFTVSIAKAPARGLAGPFEREAIRPHVAANFETMLKAAVKHAAMLRYLDNDQSAGPQSRAVRAAARRAGRQGETPRLTGLNENLAREVLELHTLGAAGGGAAHGGWGGYTQADVTAFAAVLTGWRPPGREIAAGRASAPVVFDPDWHEPGPKTVLGRRYPEGPEALDQLLHDLALHPATARHLAFKLARHVVADEPAPALVARLAGSFQRSGGDLGELARTLVESPEAWAAAPAKLKSPEEFVLSTARMLQLGDSAFARLPDGGIGTLGQRVQAAPSPAGWPDRAEEWLGPEAVWKRVEWATRVAARAGRQTDARALAVASLGPWLGDASRRQIERAADGPQALALLLLAPEFQRR